MDYTTQPFWFNVRKAVRYVRLYGLSRTLVKIEAQNHLNRNYDALPPERTEHTQADVGLIGCGNFAYSTIAHYLIRSYGPVVRGVMDINVNRAASLFEKYGARYYTVDPDRIINDRNIRIVYISSNHASHAEYAIKALMTGKDVHIEKPHVVSRSQLDRLCEAMQRSGGRVKLGFNRTNSPIGRRIKQCLDADSGPAMYNWFLAGHRIEPDHWYFSEGEGGRVLGNLCHWTDFIYWLTPENNRYPIVIRPTRARKADCDIAITYGMGDGSIAAITFSAKGHTFEGVRERFAAHRGDTLVSMDDFSQLTVQVGSRKHTYSTLFRDHGHRKTIQDSYLTTKNNLSGESVEYVRATAELFLATKNALDSNETITVVK